MTRTQNKAELVELRLATDTQQMRDGYNSLIVRGNEEAADLVLEAGFTKNNIQENITKLSTWIDGSYPPNIIGTELHTRRRTDKIMEEAGEVMEAVGGLYGENPRKGVTHNLQDVLGELLDVAVTALGAYESITGNQGEAVEALSEKLDKIINRNGLA